MYIARTFRLKLKSQSFGVQSRIVPWCTKPAQLNSTSSGGSSSIGFATAASSSTSSSASVHVRHAREARRAASA